MSLIAAWYLTSESSRGWESKFLRIARVAYDAMDRSPVDCRVPVMLLHGGAMPSDEYITLECILFDVDSGARALEAALRSIDEPWMVAVGPGSEELRARLPLHMVFFGQSALGPLSNTGRENARYWSERLDMPVACPRDDHETDQIRGAIARHPLDRRALLALVEPIAREAGRP